MPARDAHDYASEGEGIPRMTRITRKTEGTPLRDEIEGKCTVHTSQGCTR